MRYRPVSLAISMALLFAVLSSCSSSGEDEFSLEGTVYSVSDIAGSWQATSADFSRDADGPVLVVDIVDEGGSVSISIQSGGDFTLTITEPSAGTDVSSGRLGFDEELLVISFDDAPDDWEYYTLNVMDLTMLIQGPGEFDFDGDGVDEAARITFEFVRS